MPVAYLYPSPPYDFSLSAAIFAGGDPQIRTCDCDLFRQALDVGGDPVLGEVFSKDRWADPNYVSLFVRTLHFQYQKLPKYHINIFL